MYQHFSISILILYDTYLVRMEYDKNAYLNSNTLGYILSANRIRDTTCSTYKCNVACDGREKTPYFKTKQLY
jgi:hypothetical protein